MTREMGVAGTSEHPHTGSSALDCLSAWMAKGEGQRPTKAAWHMEL
jgi:hypothetical protein